MGLFSDIYNTVAKFFRPQEEQGDASKSVATNRLKLVLMQDRTNLTPKILEQMRGELIDLLSRYVELDKELLELNFEQEGEQVALMLSIPVIRAKDEEEIEAALKEEAEKLAEKAEKEAMLYNTQLVISPVPLSESKFKEIKTDPVAIQSIWRGGNYLNLILQVKVKDQKHGYHFIENKLENKDGEQTLYLTLYHDRNNDIEGFNRKVYLSVPLWAYAGKLHKGDKIVFNIRTYKEGMTSRIFYF